MRLRTFKPPNFGDALARFRTAVSGIDEPNLAVVRLCIEPAVFTLSWIGLLPNNPLAISHCGLCVPVAFDPFAIENTGDTAANEAEAQQGEEWIEFQNCLSSAFTIPGTHDWAHHQSGGKV